MNGLRRAEQVCENEKGHCHTAFKRTDKFRHFVFNYTHVIKLLPLVSKLHMTTRGGVIVVVVIVQNVFCLFRRNWVEFNLLPARKNSGGRGEESSTIWPCPLPKQLAGNAQKG